MKHVRKILVLTLLIALLLLAFKPWDTEFLQDDYPAFLQHPAAHWPLQPLEIVRAPYFGDREHRYIKLSRPVATLSFALEEGLGLTSSTARHSVQLSLYLLGILLFFAVFQPLVGRDRAGIAAFFFALYPVHVEVVMQVAYRPELLAFLFELACLWLFLQFRQGLGKPLHLALAFLAFALALWSKEQALMVLPVATLWALTSRQRLKKLVPLLGIWLLTALLWLAWRYWLFGGVTSPEISVADNPLAGQPADVRVYTALAITWRALTHAIFPLQLAPDYSWNAWPPLHNFTFESLLGALVLLGLLLGMIYFWLRARKNLPVNEYHMSPGELPLLALAWTLATWLPVSNLLFPSTTLYADRLLFAPTIPLLLVFAEPIVRWFEPKVPPVGRDVVDRMLRTGVEVLFFLLVFRPVGRQLEASVTAWSHELSLYQRGVELQPDSLRMQFNLAYTLEKAGKLHEAWPHAEKALELRPEDVDALALNLELARKSEQCHAGIVPAHTLANLPKPATHARRIALEWAMACGKFAEGWQVVKVIQPHKLKGNQPLDVFALGVAASETTAVTAWAQPLVANPWTQPAFVSAAVFGAEKAGRPLEALQYLVHLHQTRPELLDLDKPALDLYHRHPGADLRGLLQSTWPGMKVD